MTSTASVTSMTSTASFYQKKLYFKVKMYIFDGLLNVINWKRPIKSQIIDQKKWICGVSQIEP